MCMKITEKCHSHIHCMLHRLRKQAQNICRTLTKFYKGKSNLHAQPHMQCEYQTCYHNKIRWFTYMKQNNYENSSLQMQLGDTSSSNLWMVLVNQFGANISVKYWFVSILTYQGRHAVYIPHVAMTRLNPLHVILVKPLRHWAVNISFSTLYSFCFFLCVFFFVCVFFFFFWGGGGGG